MRKVLSKYINAKEVYIKEIKAKLNEINAEINECKARISAIIEEINSAKPSDSCTVSELLAIDSYLNSLRIEKQNLHKKLTELTKQMENYETILKNHFAEKKAAEKFLKKLREEQVKEELKEEVKLADETYNFKYIRDFSDGKFSI